MCVVLPRGAVESFYHIREGVADIEEVRWDGDAGEVRDEEARNALVRVDFWIGSAGFPTERTFHNGAMVATQRRAESAGSGRRGAGRKGGGGHRERSR